MKNNMTSLPVFILLLISCFCKSDDRLTPAKPLFPGDKLISNGGVFALGFFSPTNSTANSYVGVWYHNIPERTYVWIANRDNPITSNSSGKLVVTNSSDLVLSDSKGRILWTTKNTITTRGDGAVAVLLNTGNFVLQSPNGTEIWQSYDHPTDIVLPGFKLWTNYKTHIAMRIVAWKGSQDPSTGNFSFSGDPSSGLQIIVLHGATPYWRSAVWNSATASGLTSSIWSQIVDDGEEIYATYNAAEGSQRTHWKLDFMGNVRFRIWNNQSSSWVVLFERPGNGCLHYGSCGPFGYCDITGAIRECKCLDGFEPAGGFHLNFSRGCLRKKVLKCGDEDQYFQTLPGMKVPDKFLYIRNRSFEECATECNRSCSCTAYAYANLSSIITPSSTGDPSRCLVWMGELVDTVRRFSGEQQQEEERCGKDCPPNYSMPAATHMHISCQYMQVKRHTTKQGNPE